MAETLESGQERACVGSEGLTGGSEGKKKRNCEIPLIILSIKTKSFGDSGKNFQLRIGAAGGRNLIIY